MKVLAIALALFLLLFGTLRAQTFEDFKQLPAAERQTMAEDVTNPHHFTDAVWQGRLSNGEDAWNKLESRRLAQINFSGLVTLFQQRRTLQQRYMAERWSRVQAGREPAALDAQLAAIPKSMQGSDDEHHATVEMLASVKVSTETQALCDAAYEEDARYVQKYAGKNIAVSKEDLLALRRSCDEYIARLDKLPHLSAGELKEAIMALPPENYDRIR